MTDYNVNQVSDKYDETRGLPPGVPEHIARWILSRLPKDPSLVEIGVGTGRIAIPFIEAGVRYTGFDISEQMMDRLRTKLGGDLRRAQIILHDIHTPLPLPDHSQDAVVAVHILHLVDAVKALTHARQVLRPGGAIIWGYESSEPNNPHQMLRDRFHAEAQALGYQKRDYSVPQGRALLAEWGSVVTQHIVTAWSRTETIQSHLDRLRGKVFSFTWGMTAEQLQIAAERTEVWAREEYGDLDQPRIDERRFVIDWHVLGGT